MLKPKALVNVQNHFAITIITNSNENSVKIDFSDPLVIEAINITK